MKHLSYTLFFILGLTLPAQALIDFDFNSLRNCQGEFGYQKLFLLDGRSESEILVKDSGATEMIKTIQFGNGLRPVTEAYSMEISKNYISYSSLKDQVKRLAIILVDKEGVVGSTELDHALLLIVTEGTLKGTVLAAHTASFDLEKMVLISDRFTCKMPSN